MRINENNIRKVIRQTLKEQADGPAFYARKSRKLQQALAILQDVQRDESMAPGGGDEELEGIVMSLSDLIDAVEEMSQY